MSRGCSRRTGPRELSLDIETDPKGQQLYAVSLWGCGVPARCIVDVAMAARLA